MVLIDILVRWLDFLLSTCNIALARLLALVIMLRTQFLDYPINILYLGNVGEFTSTTFNNYCRPLRIPAPYIHTHNGLVESSIKQIQIIARTLLLHIQLPSSAWRRAIFHVAALIRLTPAACCLLPTRALTYTSHLHIFGCVVQFHFVEIGTQWCLGIFMGFNSLFIIRYLELIIEVFLLFFFVQIVIDET